MLGVLEKNVVHVGARILVEAVARSKDDDSNLAPAQHRQLIRFLYQPSLALAKCDLHEGVSYFPQRDNCFARNDHLVYAAFGLENAVETCLSVAFLPDRIDRNLLSAHPVPADKLIGLPYEFFPRLYPSQSQRVGCMQRVQLGQMLLQTIVLPRILFLIGPSIVFKCLCPNIF